MGTGPGAAPLSYYLMEGTYGGSHRLYKCMSGQVEKCTSGDVRWCTGGQVDKCIGALVQ